MRRSIFRSLIVLALAHACLIVAPVASADDKNGLVDRTIPFETMKRSYHVHLPPGFQPGAPIPMVLVFHTANSDGPEMAELTGFNELADKYNFVVVYPDGIKGTWNDGRRTNWAHHYNDVGFVDAICDHLVKKLNVDPLRIYAAGLANGGFFAQYFCIKGHHRLAGVASVAATLPQVVYNAGRPKHPASVLFILGMNDPLVPFGGGYIEPGKYGQNKGVGVSASMAIDYWVKCNGCKSQYEAGEFPDSDKSDNTRVKYARYCSCPGDKEVAVFAVEGGGNTWPSARLDSSEGKFGKTSRDVDATALIWDFFQKHKLAPLQ